ncbi:NADP-dependent malic enzyme [Drosophila pseudoobscura]|uniref:NADP-dependent malic enzyme n=1 Tax=Drosophila pseudoobscura pseudoobscura TaxID=46245 RepID=A0A6I8UT07_DROPS|nr:NADP-dependent malic enzyme [Drosophila pseudoobscura]
MTSPRSRKGPTQREKDELDCVTGDAREEQISRIPRELDNFWRMDPRFPTGLHNGHACLGSNLINKSLGFSDYERRVLSIHGMLPVAVRTMDEQVVACKMVLDQMTTRTQKYMYLHNLECTNRRLFYRLLQSDWDTYMPVLDSSHSDFLIKNFSLFYHRPQGMYITIKDLGHVGQVLRNWPRRAVRCVLVTNGACLLSVGDFGINAMANIMSKLHQNVVLGGIHPDFCLPLVLDVGTDNEDLLQDPLYMGLREHRTSRSNFHALFDEFALAVLQQFGPRTIILCKNFDAHNAIHQLKKYRHLQCLVDIEFQCQGACGLSGVIVANRLKRMEFKSNTFLFYGTNPMNIGMARLCLVFFKKEGLIEDAAHQRIWFFDEKGLVVGNRQGPHIPEVLQEFVNYGDPTDDLAMAIDLIRPNVLVGAGSQPNAFTKDVLRAMERSAEQPIIFAMSRPIENAECSAEDAFTYTKGRCIFISGSSIPRVKYANKWYQPGRSNSVYLQPGISQGILLSGMNNVPDETFLVAAERLACLVWPDDLAQRNVYPPMRKVQCINQRIAEAVFAYAFRKGLATLFPEPDNPTEYIKRNAYDSSYRTVASKVYCMEESIIATTESQKYYKHKI